MTLKEFICWYIRIHLPSDDNNKITVWEIGSTEMLDIEKGDEVYGVLLDGRIIDRIFEGQDYNHKLVFSTGETYAPEQFKLIGKL